MATASDPTLAQMAFVQSLQDEVSQLLSSRLDGTFAFISNPSGFHYQLTVGGDGFYNPKSLQDLDNTVAVGSNGILTMNTGSTFSSLYTQILNSSSYVLSKADQQKLNDSLALGEAQQGSLISAFETSMGPITSSLITTSQCVPQNKIGYVLWYVSKNWPKGIPQDAFPSLRVAFQQWKALAAPAVTISQAQALANARLSAAIDNATHPSATNGGFQIGSDGFGVGYSGLPSSTVLVSSLGPANAGNAVKVTASVSVESSTSSKFSIDGKVGFTVPLDWIKIRAGASASYDLQQLHSLSQSMSISLEYPSVTVVGSSPLLLDNDAVTGWYDGTIIHEIVENTGTDSTGYALVSDEFGIDETFGPGGRFARPRTLVLSQLPTVTMIFHQAKLSDVQSLFQEKASVSVDLFGFIPLGSVNQSYSISKLDQDSQSGDVSVTFGPPSISGTVPPQQQTCNVLGGVIDHPS